MVALLRKYDIRGKLIQSMDGFSFWNLAEIRYFLKCLNKGNKVPIIPQQLWDEAKLATFSMYAKSNSLNYVKRCIELFEQINKVKLTKILQLTHYLLRPILDYISHPNQLR